MANDLTGDFDVVVQFSKGAADRVLAAMHRAKRFPHSLSILVNDVPGPKLHPWDVLTHAITSLVDRYGNAIASAGRLAQVQPPRPRVPSPGPQLILDSPLVSPDMSRMNVEIAQRSHLQGRAQLQLSTPIVSVPDASGARLTLVIQMMARYFPDAGTRMLPEYMRGEMRITVGVNQVAAQAGSIVNVDLHGNVDVDFTTAWASAPVGGSDEEAIKKAIRNSIMTSFQPSNASLPAAIKQMRFKTMAGALPAVSFLLKRDEGWADSGSVNEVFLNDGDLFAFAAGADFVIDSIGRMVNRTLTKSGQRNFPFTFEVVVKFLGYVVSRTKYTYDVSLDTVTVQLLDGRILLTIDGHADTSSALPNFEFVATQAFTLNLVEATAGLALLGDLSVHIKDFGDLRDSVFGPFIPSFETTATNNFRPVRDQILASAQNDIRNMLSADQNIGEFLTRLMNPLPKPGGPQPEAIDRPGLAYTSFEISPSGLVLHGSLDVQPWPAVHAEFALDYTGEYSALNSWIPGGTIKVYEWTEQNHQLLRRDENTFVYGPHWGLVAGRLAVEGARVTLQSAEVPLSTSHIMDYAMPLRRNPSCVMVKGTRISAAGPVYYQNANGMFCRWHAFPLGSLQTVMSQLARKLPDMALTQRNASGSLEVVGHTSPWAVVKRAGEGSTNAILYFAGGESPYDLDHLPQALIESRRDDTAAAILTVLPGGGLARTKPVDGILFAEDQDGAWEALFEVKRRPATILVSPSGKLLWRHEGELPPQELAEALRKHLAAGGVFSPRLLELNVIVGQAPPDFLFEAAPGVEFTLRKLVGRPVALVFWKSSSRPSMEMVRRLQGWFESTDELRPVVLAINDGDAPEEARRAAGQSGFLATLVTDSQRTISLAYGVNIWPTTVWVDAAGLVSYIWYGLFSPEQAGESSEAETAPRHPAEPRRGQPEKTDKPGSTRPGEIRRSGKE